MAGATGAAAAVGLAAALALELAVTGGAAAVPRWPRKLTSAITPATTATMTKSVKTPTTWRLRRYTLADTLGFGAGCRAFPPCLPFPDVATRQA